MKAQAIYRKPAAVPHPFVTAWRIRYQPELKALLQKMHLVFFGNKKTASEWTEDAVALCGAAWCGGVLVITIIEICLDKF